ncbi:MAG: FAD-dependent oxidoreductase [Pedobacter sp.]|nr:FAD-dependent oxidoreductase [Pedobacter sp.]MDQ8052536.1 FAD-dependent oxidoreductase [Pedobacter sp.]
MIANLSYWEKKNFFAADIIIIGSGIVGLNAALTIKEKLPNLSVFVLERGFLPSGASTKNAGFACFGSISELIEQEKISGPAGLHQLISKRWQGLLKLRKLLGDENIDFHQHGGYELFRPNEYTLAEHCVAKLSHYNAMIEDIVHQKNVYVSADQQISSFGFNDVQYLIENKLEAQLDPGRMMKALIAKCMALGILFYTNCTVNQINHETNGLTLDTSQGFFKAKKVLVANNAFVNELLPDLAVVPGRGQVVVTKPIPRLKLKGTYHYDKGYYYFRNIDGRVLLGGGRNLDYETEATTAFGETPLVQQSLTKLLAEVILPDTSFEIEHKWSGIMAFGPQLSPIVEEAKPDVFCAVRCNGMGIAIGSHTGEAAAELLIKSL